MGWGPNKLQGSFELTLVLAILGGGGAWKMFYRLEVGGGGGASQKCFLPIYSVCSPM